METAQRQNPPEIKTRTQMLLDRYFEFLRENRQAEGVQYVAQNSRNLDSYEVVEFFRHIHDRAPFQNFLKEYLGKCKRWKKVYEFCFFITALVTFTAVGTTAAWGAHYRFSDVNSSVIFGDFALCDIGFCLLLAYLLKIIRRQAIVVAEVSHVIDVIQTRTQPLQTLQFGSGLVMSQHPFGRTASMMDIDFDPHGGDQFLTNNEEDGKAFTANAQSP